MSKTEQTAEEYLFSLLPGWETAPPRWEQVEHYGDLRAKEARAELLAHHARVQGQPASHLTNCAIHQSLACDCKWEER
jgi:hypothetical protein